MIHKFQMHQLRSLNSKKNGELKKLKKPLKWLFPHSTERQYIKYMFEYCGLIRKSIENLLIPQLPRLLTAATIENPEEKRNDDFLDDLDLILNNIFDLIFPDEQRLIEKAIVLGIQTAVFNQNQF